MTLESVLGEECRLLEQTECVDLYESGDIKSIYRPSEAGIQPIEPPRSHFDRPRRQTPTASVGQVSKKATAEGVCRQGACRGIPSRSISEGLSRKHDAKHPGRC